jgi:hypothetical protein
MKKSTWTLIIAIIGIVSCYSCSKIGSTGIYSCVCNYELNGNYYTNDTQATFPRQSEGVSQAECIDDGASLTTSGAKQVNCVTK